MTLDFENKLVRENISIYYDDYLTNIIQNMPEYMALSESVKMALLPEGKDSFEFDETSATAYVLWNAEIETRGWGIKGISANVKSVDVTLYFKIIGFTPDDEEVEFEGEIEISSATQKPGAKYETFDVVVKDDDIAASGLYTIDNLDVDMKNRVIEVYTSTVR